MKQKKEEAIQFIKKHLKAIQTDPEIEKTADLILDLNNQIIRKGILFKHYELKQDFDDLITEHNLSEMQ